MNDWMAGGSSNGLWDADDEYFRCHVSCFVVLRWKSSLRLVDSVAAVFLVGTYQRMWLRI